METQNIIFIITIITSILISITDLGASSVEVAADAATVGVAGVPAGIADLGIELITEAIQNIIITVSILYLSGVKSTWSWILIFIVVFMSIIDIILSIVQIPIPYIDILKLITEVFTELIQNGILIGVFVKNSNIIKQ